MQRFGIILSYTFCLSLSITFVGLSQSLPQIMQENFSLIRAGKATASINWQNYTEEELQLAHKQLSPAQMDTLSDIRMKAYAYEKAIYEASHETAFKKAVVANFLNGLSDESTAVQKEVSASLRQFEPTEFTAESRAILVAQLNPIPIYYEDLVLALAYLNERTAIAPMIDHIRFQFGEMEQMQKWQVHIALSRLGEQPALDYIVKKAKVLPVNDDMVYEIYPTLVFTKQKAAIDVLVEQVFNDEANCLPADPNSSKKITCAYRVLELIAPAIKDFPLEIEEASGDLLVDDYKKGLKTARKWLEKNRTSYEVI